ncbi:hypothetical protein BC835DRAFT_1080240 [Cytidiella melzeri]|nr:hypothetical protein BC835DRAFT_1080240 [Cytidiella melzeri]
MSHNAILQNSPALHSLKREQLVKLCKKHSLKANGKSIELVQRLKQHGSTLPPEALEYRWSDGSDEEQNGSMSPSPSKNPPRPSEQWEIVMDNIEEVEENGTVKSSLKAAIVSSFGIRRADTSNSAGSSFHAGSINMATADFENTSSDPCPSHGGPFDFPESPGLEPIPGTLAKPGAPAPANARLSTGTGAQPGVTTTIRLIPSNSVTCDIPTPPRIPPFHTTFDLDLSSPDGGAKRQVWPASPMGTNNTRKSARIYPAIPYEDIAPSPFKSNFGTPVAPSVRVSEATPAKSPYTRLMPLDAADDVFSPAKPAPSGKQAEMKELRLSMPNNQPFLFGSPIVQPNFSSAQFNAAAAGVLEEMNKRLEEAGVQKIEKTVLASIDKTRVVGAASQQHQRTDSDASGVARFAKAHDEAFNKMDSIANHYAARRPLPVPPVALGKKRKSDAAGLGHGPAPNIKRQSSVAETRVISNGVRKKMGIPGGFGDDEDDEDEEEREDPGDRRSSKRIRIADSQDIHKGKRPSLLPTEKTEEEVRKQEREREAARRYLNAARRRSSRGRASLAGKAAVPPPKSSRFGFLSSAKSLVRNVWNMGAGGSKASGIPVAKPVSKSALLAEKVKPTKSTPSLPSAASAVAKSSRSTLLEVSDSRSGATNGSANTVGNTSRSRSPIPSFAQPSSIAPRVNTTSSTTAPLDLKPRSSSLNANRSKTSFGTGGTSSLGARTSGASSCKAGVDGHSSDTAKPPHPPRKRTNSTLMQPTASFLAKQQQNKPLPSVGEHPSRVLSPTNLRQITNSPRSPTSKIFSKPVTAQTFGGSSPVSPSADQNVASLGGAAASMLANTTSAKPTQRVPLAARKPRVSRSRVTAKLQQQRDAAGTTSTSGPLTAATRARSSTGATPRRSLGAMKNQRISAGGEALKMKARQSEFARRRRSAARSSVGLVMNLDR